MLRKKDITLEQGVKNLEAFFSLKYLIGFILLAVVVGYIYGALNVRGDATSIIILSFFISFITMLVRVIKLMKEKIDALEEKINSLEPKNSREEQDKIVS